MKTKLTKNKMKYPTLSIAVLLLLGTVHSSSAQVTQYAVDKSAYFNQTSTADPVVNPAKPLRLQSEVIVFTQGDLSSNPTVTKPAGGTGTSPLTLIYSPDSSSYNVHIIYSDLASLDAAYPDGTYVMNMVSPSFGTKNVNLTLNPDSYRFPRDIPKLSNTTWSGGVLTLDATVSNTLNWNTFTQLSGDDLVFFELNSDLTEIHESGSLTSYTINAGSLTAGQTCQGSIVFAHVTTKDTTSVAGAIGLAGYGVVTEFSIQAVPEPSTWGMFGLGAIGLLFSHTRRRKRTQGATA